MLPNFFIIGAQKSGTTSLNDILALHPEVFMPEDKEIPYFYNEKLYSKGLENYKWYFQKWNGQNLVGNAPVNLLYLTEITVKRLYEYNHKLKLICCLRNPIERAYSAYWYFRSNLWENAATFEEALEKEDWIKQNGTVEQKCNLTYLEHGLYHQQLKAFYEFFSEDQILVLLFEEFKKKPDEIHRRIAAFLNIEYDYFPKVTKKATLPLHQGLVLSTA